MMLMIVHKHGDKLNIDPAILGKKNSILRIPKYPHTHVSSHYAVFATKKWANLDLPLNETYPMFAKKEKHSA